MHEKRINEQKGIEIPKVSTYQTQAICNLQRMRECLCSIYICYFFYNFQIDFEKYSSVLVTTHFVAMCIGILSLGFAADRFGRRFILFGSLVLVFVSSLLGSFFVQSIKTFIPMRILAAFGSGRNFFFIFHLFAYIITLYPYYSICF